MEGKKKGREEGWREGRIKRKEGRMGGSREGSIL